MSIFMLGSLLTPRIVLAKSIADRSFPDPTGPWKRREFGILPDSIIDFNSFFAYSPIQEAFKSKSKGRFDLSVKEKARLMV